MELWLGPKINGGITNSRLPNTPTLLHHTLIIFSKWKNWDIGQENKKADPSSGFEAI